MKNNLLQMHEETEQPSTPRPKFDPKGDIEMYHINRIWAEQERAERTRKRYILIVALACLAVAALSLVLWIGG
jgi:hypothetical protein